MVSSNVSMHKAQAYCKGWTLWTLGSLRSLGPLRREGWRTLSARGSSPQTNNRPMSSSLKLSIKRLCIVSSPFHPSNFCSFKPTPCQDPRNRVESLVWRGFCTIPEVGLGEQKLVDGRGEAYNIQPPVDSLVMTLSCSGSFSSFVFKGPRGLRAPVVIGSVFTTCLKYNKEDKVCLSPKVAGNCCIICGTYQSLCFGS